MNYAHIGFKVKNFEESKIFYKQSLAPLGLSLTNNSTESARFGRDNRTMLYFHKGKNPTSPFHIAFEANTKEQVDEFYKAAIATGGKDNGAPGIRKDYSPTYYSAFVIDPNGHNIEAVCR